MRGFVHDSQRAEHLLGAGGHRALPSQLTQHVRDADGPIEGDSPLGGEVAESVLDLYAKLNDQHQGELARELSHRGKVFFELWWEGVGE
jgi:hypothetical protein